MISNVSSWSASLRLLRNCRSKGRERAFPSIRAASAVVLTFESVARKRSAHSEVSAGSRESSDSVGSAIANEAQASVHAASRNSPNDQRQHTAPRMGKPNAERVWGQRSSRLQLEKACQCRNDSVGRKLALTLTLSPGRG